MTNILHTCRRRVFQKFDESTTRPSHAGLWLDRYLKYQTNDPRNKVIQAENAEVKTARARLIAEASDIDIPVGYQHAADTYVRRFTEGSPLTVIQTRFYKTTSRCIIGLGQKGVLEAGISLNHTWGTPIISGSSLKGLAARVAHLFADDPAWRNPSVANDNEGESYTYLFGSTERKGLIIFHDAWWLPDKESSKPYLTPDVLTVHYPAYYRNDSTASNFRPPDGMDSPEPVPFITVPKGLIFAITLEAPRHCEAWIAAAWELLDEGLKVLGIGAKTNAGYGRLKNVSQEIYTPEEIALLKNLTDGNEAPCKAAIIQAVTYAEDTDNYKWVKELVSRLSALRKENKDGEFRDFINPKLKLARARAGALANTAT